jgi:drug/metabolite transporter (DMT)-like permease
VLAIVLALISALGYGGSDFTAGLSSRETSVLLFTLLSELIALVLLLLIVPWISPQSPTPAALAWGALAGGCEVAGTYALYLGFRHAAFSVASPLSAVGSAAFAVLAGLLLGERPGTLALIGIGLALPAIIAVSADSGDAADPPDEADATGEAGETGDADAGRTGPVQLAHGQAATGRHALGVILGILAGGGFAGMFIALNQAGSSRDVWPLLSSQGAACLCAAVPAIVAGQLRRPARRTVALAALTGATGTVGSLFYFLSTHRGLLAITAVITSLYPAGTIILARAMLSERLTRVRLAGLCLAAASVALIAVSGAG